MKRTPSQIDIYQLKWVALSSAIASQRVPISAASDVQFEEKKVVRDKFGRFASAVGSKMPGSGDKKPDKKKEFNEMMGDVRKTDQQWKKSRPGKLAAQAGELFKSRKKMKPDEYMAGLKDFSRKNAVGMAGSIGLASVGALTFGMGAIAVSNAVAAIISTGVGVSIAAAVTGALVLNPLGAVLGVAVGVTGAVAAVEGTAAAMTIAGWGAFAIGASLSAIGAALFKKGLFEGMDYVSNMDEIQDKKWDLEREKKRGIFAASLERIPPSPEDKEIGKAILDYGEKRLKASGKPLLSQLREMEDKDFAAFINKKDAHANTLSLIRAALVDFVQSILTNGVESKISENKGSMLQSMLS